MPTIHEQGDEIDASLNKTNESISLKAEPLHKKNEDDYSIKNFQNSSISRIKSNTNNTISSTLVNDKPYSLNMSSSTAWLNRGLAKLSKVIFI